MKRRDPTHPVIDPALEGLIEAFRSLESAGELRAFLEDLCTPSELESMADRWRVVPLLTADVPYREIHDRTGVSVTTIGRVARCLDLGSGGYRIAIDRLEPAATDASH